MTKNDIAAKLCYRLGFQRTRAIQTVDAVTDILKDAFVKGENIYLRGFGTFEVKITPEKPARNIRAGTQVVVPAHKTVKFKLSKELKNKMNS